jgi:hypothetical protein
MRRNESLSGEDDNKSWIGSAKLLLSIWDVTKANNIMYSKAHQNSRNRVQLSSFTTEMSYSSCSIE